MGKPRFRSIFDGLPAYEPSRAVRSATGDSHLLAANESPHRPLPDIVAAITEAAETINRYPDFGGTELTARIARAHGVTEDRVAIGAGSVALLQMLLQAVADADAEVMYAWRSFELYPVLADLAGVRGVRIPLVDERHDLNAMAERVGDDTRLVLVCNPNNPTGTLLGHDDLRAFADRVPADRLIAVDEAYFEYVRQPGARSAIALTADRPNLVVLRTFSKAYGLAGLRVGYLVGPPYVVARLRKAYLPYSVSAVAQAAALAALGRQKELFSQVDEVVAERARVRGELTATGWAVPRSESNFLWLRMGAASGEFGDRCGDAGVAVRVFPGEGLRVSIGTPADNDAFLAAAAAWRAKTRSPAADGPATVSNC
ncbi:putative phenylalanine aminotransferase [Sphaerisporangium krabiense]|uniref:Histidinol-phosphate aminotransferase n=1 Tax=Sphaerisporangium krabiense TaxID=763782 RepID=A0A7W8Z236_9ACTN|nr:histidinol-phosphate transaminase [Sphaerisporangium krabiense]MBB5626041.1 histidinol-phosphate aminotransferase [Sphaerisporangium krabiense]GII64846.1 putative phenylalanine aminotransferase [Sphaerisporangium krabiense]